MSSSTMSKLPPISTLGPLIALLLAVGFFATQSDRFLSVQNFSLILQQVMVVGVDGHWPDAWSFLPRGSICPVEW